MKSFLLAVLAAFLTASLAWAQTAPTASDNQAPGTPPSGLTKQEREHAVAYLRDTQKEFLAALEGVSEEQWKFKAAPDKWSIAETAEHIAVTEDLIWAQVSEKIMKSPAAPEKRAAVQGKDEMIMKVIPDRSRKFSAPEQLNPTGKWPTRAELVKHFEATRAREIAYLQETKEDLRNHFAEHPFVKTLDAYQWLLLNGAHAQRHTAQILEVKADPNFPKS